MVDSSPASSTVYARPLDSEAMRRRVTGSGGTGNGEAYGYGFGIVAPGVPSATVKMGTFARPAWRATCTGSRPVVVLPSDSSTIAAGGRRPFLRSRERPSSAAASASPVAVDPSATRPLMIRRTSSRRVVGDWTASGAAGEAAAPTPTGPG